MSCYHGLFFRSSLIKVHKGCVPSPAIMWDPTAIPPGSLPWLNVSTSAGLAADHITLPFTGLACTRTEEPLAYGNKMQSSQNRCNVHPCKRSCPTSHYISSSYCAEQQSSSTPTYVIIVSQRELGPGTMGQPGRLHLRRYSPPHEQSSSRAT